VDVPQRLARGTAFRTDIPARLDNLPWSQWHWRVVLALGITWALDGLEASLIANIAGVLTDPQTLGLDVAQVGIANSTYLFGQIFGALLFGHLTDRFGRKRLFLVTLGVYLIGTASSGLASSFQTFVIFRFIAGSGIGGEYAAINSAIDELIPARLRGRVDLAINGSYWLGVALGGVLTLLLLDPRWLPLSVSWRLVFLFGATLGLCIILVRRHMPESPRWLLLHGRIAEAAVTIVRIEKAVHGERTIVEAGTVRTLEMTVLGTVGFGHVAHLLLRHHFRRTVLGLALMVSQAVFYNAIFFSYALILVRFYDVPAGRTGLYIIPFALGNFFGPLLLGRLFDTVGRRHMISITYIVSGVALFFTGWAFAADLLTATTQTLCWCAVFFVASAAASSAYLTVSELFPVQIRGIAIALFFVVGQFAGAIATAVFSWMIDAANRPSMFLGYSVSAVLMIAAGIVAAVLAVDAERRSLEELAGEPSGGVENTL